MSNDERSANDPMTWRKSATADSSRGELVTCGVIGSTCRSERHIIFEIRISSFLRASSSVIRHLGPLQIVNRARGLRVTQRCSHAPAGPEVSFDEFHFGRGDVTFVVRLRQKSADSSASNFAIIASKFIHIHADEFPS
jgi:hypothetical protein